MPQAISHITASDHLNYWQMGFKAVTITDTAHFRNPNYHTKNDTFETIDFVKMQYVVDMVVGAIENITIDN